MRTFWTKSHGLLRWNTKMRETFSIDPMWMLCKPLAECICAHCSAFMIEPVSGCADGLVVCIGCFEARQLHGTYLPLRGLSRMQRLQEISDISGNLLMRCKHGRHPTEGERDSQQRVYADAIRAGVRDKPMHLKHGPHIAFIKSMSTDAISEESGVCRKRSWDTYLDGSDVAFADEFRVAQSGGFSVQLSAPGFGTLSDPGISVELSEAVDALVSLSGSVGRTNLPGTGCQWTGPVKDFKTTNTPSEAPMAETGCLWTGPVKDFRTHLHYECMHEPLLCEKGVGFRDALVVRKDVSNHTHYHKSGQFLLRQAMTVHATVSSRGMESITSSTATRCETRVEVNKRQHSDYTAPIHTLQKQTIAGLLNSFNALQKIFSWGVDVGGGVNLEGVGGGATGESSRHSFVEGHATGFCRGSLVGGVDVVRVEFMIDHVHDLFRVHVSTHTQILPCLIGKHLSLR